MPYSFERSSSLLQKTIEDTTLRMTANTKMNRHARSPWEPQWSPSTEVTDENQFPIFEKLLLESDPTYSTSFVRTDDCNTHGSSLLHGFVDDKKLQPFIKNPGRYLQKIAQHLAVITPDFSVMLGMPKHDRMRSVHLSRLIGSYWQRHGLRVVPNIRWAELSDIAYAIEGLPTHSTIAVSTQNLHSDWELIRTFESGLELVITGLEPEHLILYGIPTKNCHSITAGVRLTELATDINRVHRKATS